MENLKYTDITWIGYRKTGYGHWKLEMDIDGKTYTAITTDSIMIDEWDGEDKDGYYANAQKAAAEYIAWKNDLEIEVNY